jgi:hypothetical protein
VLRDRGLTENLQDFATTKEHFEKLALMIDEVLRRSSIILERFPPTSPNARPDNGVLLSAKRRP